MKNKRVLIAPLSWGIGHATRLIPVIDEIIAQGSTPVIAASGKAIDVLYATFPDAEFIQIYEKEVHYKGGVVAALVAQWPRLSKLIKRDQSWVEDHIEKLNIDLILSDNRYGFRSLKRPSVLITHQINVILPKFLWFIQPIVQRYIHGLINRFNLCLVPDEPNDKSLAGSLSSTKTGKFNAMHCGILSRLKPIYSAHKNIDCLFLFSGPEPLRTKLENEAWKQIKSNRELRCVIIRGLPGANEALPALPNLLEVIGFADTAKLTKCIQSAHVVIARSGYSTVMDLQAMGCQAFFVPTPQQPEQEYIAQYLKDLNIADFATQNTFNLQNAWLQSKNYEGFKCHELHKSQLLSKAVAAILALE